MEVRLIVKDKPTDPIIILSRLPSDELTPLGLQKVLVLDYDGDLTFVTLKTTTIEGAERNLQKFIGSEKKLGVLACSNLSRGVLMMPLEISRSQKEALENMRRHWAETGYSPRVIPAEIRALLLQSKILARGVAESPVIRRLP